MTEVERVVFESPLVRVGIYDCPTHHERFPGGLVEDCLTAFPRTAVVIEQDGHTPVVADHNTAIVYNKDQSYRRRKLDARGDRCDYIAVSHDIAAEIVGSPSSDPGSVFRFDHVPVSAGACRAERAFVDRLGTVAGVSSPEVEETAIAILATVLGSETGRDGDGRASTRLRHGSLVEETKAVLSHRYAERLDLTSVASSVGSSPYHLSRIFRARTGSTIHAYLTQIRLREALELMTSGYDIASVAFMVGFSSHSHFTERFGAAFGVAPHVGRHRNMALREMRKILKV